MKLNSVSAPAVSNHTHSMSYHHALQSAHFSGFIHSNVKVNHLITITNSRTSCTFQWLAVNRISLTKSRIIPFAVPNENDQVEGDLIRGLVEDNKLHLECGEDEGSNLSEAEVETSVSGVDFDSVVEVLGREGSILDKLKAIQLHMLASEQWNASKLQLCHRNYLDSATNLIHYLAFRCLDVEKLKDNLSMIGLLNLENINPHVLASLAASIRVLENFKSKNISGGVFADEKLNQQASAVLTIQKMRNKASSNRKRLLGLPEDGRTTHIMVTVGEEATQSETLITDLIEAGTSVIRINCAHGSPSIWSEIIKRVKESSQMLEKPCQILMDLAGPKLRTGKFKLGPAVKKISPQKTASGHVMFPAQVWLSHEEAGPPSPHLSLDAMLVVDNQEFFTKLDIGDTLRFSDARGKWRGFKISRKFHVFSGTGFVAECTRTAYVKSGTRLFIKGKKSKSPAGVVVDVPLTDLYVRIRVGDRLIISRGNASKEEELTVSSSGVHRITCSSGYLFDSVKPGDPIAFDDGKIWGVIQGTSVSEIVVSITHASPKGTKLGSDKSINIPASEVQFEGLTSKDLTDLEFVANNADIVGVSFVRDVSDIVVLRRELEKRKLENLGIVLKIETKRGFEKLPLLLLEAMKSPNPVGVMIARGDLAVECGWEKLAEMQEEIIALCDAAHIPVIWATQVLESLVKTGVPTRAEITDAANGRRVSCVMLNKGQNITQAVSTLNNILRSNSRKLKTDLQSIFLSGHLS